ncbi:hypothetical protein GWO43_27170 [candidate division KSB1 bacterium]|nr:hypothetical protein [candidate division KSB1 bacterium]NIR70334.1 hypothetical protein [candidate division KSB1 bacterium]NIS27638.1 hypothetical protein [candidate division KSB1 bacterium]NIT74478.1 hypothetical protein [candidate division KSB1 bacterium]NIU29003.1 hypothetical protein [candidate division KSB1 bacterium]
MLKEVLHFVAHVPKTLALKRQLNHPEFYDTLMLRGEKAGLAHWRANLVEDVRGRVYRDVLQKELPYIENILWAKKFKKLPMVFSRQEYMAHQN